MPHYMLFAARNGDVFAEEGRLQDDSVARAWAAERLADEFGLGDLAKSDFDEALGQCDGALLEKRSSDPLHAILVAWATSQIGMLDAIGDQLGGEFAKERDACVVAFVDLISAARP